MAPNDFFNGLLEPISPTPYDRVVGLEITAEDPSIEGYGPAVAYEYEVEFNAALHTWVEGEQDLLLRLEALDLGELASADNSGGGRHHHYDRQTA